MVAVTKKNSVQRVLFYVISFQYPLAWACVITLHASMIIVYTHISFDSVS